jgi:hypothetical protein
MRELSYYSGATAEDAFQSKGSMTVGFGEFTAAQKETIASAPPEVRDYVDLSRPFGHDSAKLAIRSTLGEQPQRPRIELDL